MNTTRLDIEKKVDRAIQLFEEGRFRPAEKVLLQALTVEPDNMGAHFELARIYRRKGDTERALSHGLRVLRLNPGEPNACLNLGVTYESMGRLDLATKYYLRELRRDPLSGEALFNIGHLYFEKHRWKRACKYLRECFEMGHPFGLEETVFSLGACYYKFRDLDSYIALYRRYLEREPFAGWAAANLGTALLYAKDYRGAALKLALAKRLGTRRSVDEKLALARRLARATLR